MSKHTPGPWAISDYKDGRYSIVIDNEGFDVAKVDYPNQEANALLIAAAPELLEALKLAKQIIGHPDDMASKFISDVIAKATGDSND